MPTPDYLREFVLPTSPVAAVDAGSFDLYLPLDATAPAPLAVLVHGGPMPAAPVAPPREWPVFRGYAAALAARGVATAVLDHSVLTSLDYAGAADRVDEVTAAGRARPEVDADRVAVWYFSGGGPLATRLLQAPPPWLRVVALSYPALQPFGGVEGFRPVDALPTTGSLPIVVTRVGREIPALTAAQEEFIVAARNGGNDVMVVDVPNGHHAFDVLDDTEQSRQALRRALDLVGDRLDAPGAG